MTDSERIIQRLDDLNLKLAQAVEWLKVIAWSAGAVAILTIWRVIPMVVESVKRGTP